MLDTRLPRRPLAWMPRLAIGVAGDLKLLASGNFARKALPGRILPGNNFDAELTSQRLVEARLQFLRRPASDLPLTGWA